MITVESSFSAKNWNASDYHSHSLFQQKAAFELLDSIPFTGSEKVLDVGCGDGKITAKLAESLPNGTVVGYDISEQMVSFAQNTYSAMSNLSFEQGEAQAIPYENEFDVVFSSYALHWATDHKAVCRGLYSALKPSGTVAAVFPISVSAALENALATLIAVPKWAEYLEDATYGWNMPEPSVFEGLLRDAGFNISRYEVASQTQVFPSIDLLGEFIRQWLPYVKILPEELKDSFMREAMELYAAQVTPKADGSISYTLDRIQFVADRS